MNQKHLYRFYVLVIVSSFILSTISFIFWVQPSIAYEKPCPTVSVTTGQLSINPFDAHRYIELTVSEDIDDRFVQGDRVYPNPILLQQDIPDEVFKNWQVQDTNADGIEDHHYRIFVSGWDLLVYPILETWWKDKPGDIVHLICSFPDPTSTFTPTPTVTPLTPPAEDNQGVPTPATLLRPSDNVAVGGNSVTFRWDTSPSSDVDVYTIRVTDDPSKIDSGPWVFDGGVDAPITEKTLSLSDGVYYWAVWACSGCKSGNNNYSDRAGPWKVTIDSTLSSDPPPYWLLGHSEAEIISRVQYRLEATFSDSPKRAARIRVDDWVCGEISGGNTHIDCIWNAVEFAEGDHTIYYEIDLPGSESNPWSNPLRYQHPIYLGISSQGLAACGSSGIVELWNDDRCLGLTGNIDIYDLAPYGFGDVPLTVNNYLTDKDVWMCESGGTQCGTIRLVGSGEVNKSVGNNNSGVRFVAASTPIPLPSAPFICDEDTYLLAHLNETGSTVLDECNGFIGTNYAPNSVVAKFGVGQQFTSGSGRTISFGSHNLSCPISIDFWFKWTGGAGRIAGQLSGGGNTGQIKWLISHDGGYPVAEIWSNGGSTWMKSHTSINDTNFHHVMLTYDCNRQAKLYLDLEMVAQMTTPGLWLGGATTLEIGSGEGIYHANGVVDEFRISKALRVPGNLGPVLVPAPVAGFNAAPVSGTAPLTVNFTDESIGSIFSYLWSYGDGLGDFFLVPGATHTYSEPGIYNVNLAVSGEGGSDTLNRSNYIIVAAPPTPTPTATPIPPTATPTSMPSGIVRFEGEDAVLNGPVVANNNSGYSGIGFVDYINPSGDNIEWMVNVDTAGQYTLVFGYANGTTSDRPLELKINGEVVSSNLSFPGTGSWTTWPTVSNDAQLTSGDNTIRLTAIGSSGPNIDYLEVVESSLPTATPTPTATGTPLPTDAPTATNTPVPQTPTPTPIPQSGTLLNSFETGVEDWWASTTTEAISVQQSNQYPTHENWSGQFNFNHASSSAYFQRTLANPQNWTSSDNINLDIWTDQQVQVALALGTGPNWDWNQSVTKPVNLNGTTVTFNLTTDWNDGSRILDPTQIRYIGLIVYPVQLGSGQIYVDNIRLTGQTPTPTATATFTSVPPAETTTPIPPTTTETSVPPTATATITPTNTLMPTATDTPVPSTATPTPVEPIELLSQPWHLSGSNGASEKYQSIDPNVLMGKSSVRITYDLHGLNALGGDASAIIFDQDGWNYISLSDYGQNGLDGSQTVEIPLSDFGLDLSQPVGTLHTRFWYDNSFAVDITNVVVQ